MATTGPVAAALWASSGAGADVAVGGVLVAIGLALFLLAWIVQRAMSGIFGLALYRFAGEGAVTGGFTAEELSSAVKVKGS